MVTKVKKDGNTTVVERTYEDATSETTAVASLSVSKGFKLKRRVILPTLSLAVGVPVVLRINEAIKASTYVDPDPAKSKEKPADICSVTNMETGEEMLLLVPSVMKSALERDYMDNERVTETVTVKGEKVEISSMVPIDGTEKYVGAIFGVQKMPKRPGKRYHDTQLVELEDE